MALKLRLPAKGEERVSWCKGIKIAVCTEEGLQEGQIDVKFAILPAAEFREQTQDDDKFVTDFVRERIRSVKGFRDDQGNEWPESEQIDFVCSSMDCIPAVYKAYLEHATGGAAKKKPSRS